MAASQTCPTCLKASTNTVAYTTTSGSGVVTGNVGTVTLSLVFNLDATGCNSSLFSNTAYGITGLNISMTMSNNVTYSSTIGGTAGTGTIGAVSTVSASALFTGFPVPNGTVVNSATAIHPTSFTISFNAVFAGLNGVSLTCPQTMTFKTTQTSTSYSVGATWPGAGGYSTSGLMYGV
jgi:hypothetical protein